MAASGRVIGLILIVVGVVLGVGIGAWLNSGMQEGTLRGSGAIFGLIFLFGIIVLPLIGGGIFLLLRGQSEAKELAEVQKQRRLLDIISTRGQVTDPVNERAVRSTLQRIARLEGVAEVISPFGIAGPLLQSRDRTVAYAQILYDRGAREVTKSQIEDLIATGQPALAAGLDVGFGGQVVERQEPEPARTSEVVGLVVAVVVLLIAFGSVIAMGAPLIGALLGVGVGMLLISLLAAAMDVISVAPTRAIGCESRDVRSPS